MFLDYHPDDLDVQISELLVATSDGSDPLVNPRVQEVLRLIREKLSMDVVFVSQFEPNRRTFRVVDTAPGKTVVVAGQSDPVEETWCQRVVDGRLPGIMKDARRYVEMGAAPALPYDVGTCLSTPVMLRDGTVFGTLCCFSMHVNEQVNPNDLMRLKRTAQLLAQDLGATSETRPMELQPLAGTPRRG